MATLGFKGFSAGSNVVLSASQGDDSDSEEVLAWGTPGAFDLEVFPTDPWIGEVVHMRAKNHSLFAVDDIYKDLDWQWDADDSGAQYTVGGGGFDNDATTGFGKTWAHAYSTAGTKNPSCSVRSVGAANVVSDSISVTVKDPDAETWTHDLYVDFGEVSGTPEFTWAPAEAGVIQHISSITELQAVNFLYGKTRITFKDDETFTWNTTAIDISGVNTRIYMTRSRSGTNRPQIKGTGWVNPGMFTAYADVIRVVVYEVDIVGGYNPVTGVDADGPFRFLYTSGTASGNCIVSFVRCELPGLRSNANGSAGENGIGSNTFATGFVDCLITDWYDYGISYFGSRGWVSIVGNRIAQSPLAIMRDGGIKGTLPGAADHGPIRIHNVFDGCIENNDLRSSTGWSQFPPGYLIQPCIRIHHEDAVQDGWEFNIQRNLGVGGTLAHVGSQSSSAPAQCQPNGLVIARNQFWGGRQGYYGFVNTDVGGVYVYNNIDYQANVYDLNEEASYSLRINNEASSGDSVKTRPVYFGFNTIVSDRSSASGGNGNFSEVKTISGTWPQLTAEHNVIWVPNHANAGSFTDYTGLSRADNFKPITGSAAIDAVSSGYPVRDYDGNLRTGNSNVGAHHDSVSSDAGVSAPSNSVVPTFAELASWTGEYAITGAGTWSNWAGRETYLFVHDWKLDGVSLTGSQNALTVVDPSSSGNLTVGLIATNLSGTRVTATSAATAV